MEVIQIAQEIEKKIKLLEQARNKLKKYGDEKSETIAQYERELALTIVKLRNNAIGEWQELKVTDLPASIIEKTARGIVAPYLLECEKAEATYKSLVVYIDCVKSELNACQSLNRYLDQT